MKYCSTWFNFCIQLVILMFNLKRPKFKSPCRKIQQKMSQPPIKTEQHRPKGSQTTLGGVEKPKFVPKIPQKKAGGSTPIESVNIFVIIFLNDNLCSELLTNPTKILMLLSRKRTLETNESIREGGLGAEVEVGRLVE